MTAEILDGKIVADGMFGIAKKTMDLYSFNDICLHVIQVGNDPASSTYIRNKERACEKIGIQSVTHHIDESASKHDVINLINQLNKDDSVTGILVQLPLPDKFDDFDVLDITSSVNSLKDVDGFTPTNIGWSSLSGYTKNVFLIPCTPLGILVMLSSYRIDIAGKNCVIVGRSNIVGKPMARLMLNENATVTVCHSHTKNLKEICKQADILVCAIGKPMFFDVKYVKDGAVVIDAGINRLDNGKLCGDVDFDAVKDVASYITPVPGGVGKTTVAALMANCVNAKMLQNKVAESKEQS